MYTQIKHLKDKGFTRHWVAKQLGIHRKTVSRYWDMPVDEYEENLHCISKNSLLSKYEEVLISWLTQFPAMSAAQVCDWLKEHYNAHFKERTVSRYVKQLRNDNGISKSSTPRMFEAESRFAAALRSLIKLLLCCRLIYGYAEYIIT